MNKAERVREVKKILWDYLMKCLDVHHKVEGREFATIPDTQKKFATAIVDSQLKEFESADIDCVMCCHQNQETLEGWFVKWAKDNGYVKKDSQIGGEKKLREVWERYKFLLDGTQPITFQEKVCIGDFLQATNNYFGGGK